LASYEKGARKSDQPERNAGEWNSTGVFSAESLKNGIFRALPPRECRRNIPAYGSNFRQGGASLFGKEMRVTIIT